MKRNESMTQRRTLLAALSALPFTQLVRAQSVSVAPTAADRSAAPPLAKGATAGIHPWMQVGDAVAADVLIDGKMVAHLDHHSAVAGLRKPPALVFALPTGLKQLRLRGQVTLAGKTSPLDTAWTVRDMAVFSAPLYDRTMAWIDRVSRTEGVGTGPAKATLGNKPAKAVLQDLEKRLGVPLPAMVKVLEQWHVNFGDSYFLPLAEMSTVTRLLLGEWDYKEKGEEGLDQILPPAVRARYDRSLAVFIEVGDGLGAMAWDPAGVKRGEPTNTWGDAGNPGAQPVTPNQGVWYWIHQDSLHKPRLLLDDDYRPKTAEGAFTHVVQRFALSHFDSPKNDRELVVDTANPHSNLLQLHFEERRKPRLWFRSYDYNYSLY